MARGACLALAPLAVLVASGTSACGEGGLVAAPVLPSGAKFAVLPVGEDAGDAGPPARPGSSTGLVRQGQVYRGTSYCRAGPITLVLRITEVDDDEVHGTVEATVSRGGARGTYEVSGTYTAGTGHLKLDAGDWVDESDEIEASDIEGTVMASGFQARFGMSGCGSVTFREGR